MWKSLFLLISLAAFCGLPVTDSQSLTLEEAMLRFFEQFRCRMIYEQDNIDLPKLEPYEEEEMTFEFDDDSLGSISLDLKNLHVEGLSTFHVPDLYFDLFTLDFWLYIELPKLTVTGWYSIDGDLDDLQLTGSGDFEFLIEGINVYMDGKQGHDGTDNSWWMERLAVEFSIEKLSGFMKGIMNDEVVEDFITHLLNNAGPRLVEAAFPDLEPEIVKYAKEMMPEMLNGTPLLDVINIIFLDVDFLMELPEDECPISVRGK